MNEITVNTQVWFLRHGKTPFNYERSKYDEFIQMLCNGHETPLAEDPAIDFTSLPKLVDFVGHSPFKRAVETAQLLQTEIDIKQMEELPILHEVKFDFDIISEHEFESLEQIRPEVLKRWYNNENRAESFTNSLARVKEIASFINKQPGKTIILVTHGWFLRLLEIYFVQGKHTITLDDLLGARLVPLGHCVKANIAVKSGVKSGMGFVGAVL